MSVREYVGARYVPLFAEPLQWSNANTYEPLTIVQHEGNSYTSRQFVPVGIDIANEEYWAQTGNYNAQIEQYRQEVQAFDGRITQNANDIAAIEENGWVATDRIADSAVTTAKISDGAVTNEKMAANSIDIDNMACRHMVVIGDSYSTTGYTPTEEQLWWNLVASQKRYEPHNFAVAGTGFLDPQAPNFRTQIQNAGSDSSFANDDVAAVYILGGLNDTANVIAETYTDVQYYNEIKVVLALAKTTFPNAEIVFGTGETFLSLEKNSVNTLTLLRKGGQAAIESGVKFINLATSLLGYEDAFAPDNHPNAIGQQVLASYMLGGSQQVHRTLPNVTFSQGGGDANVLIRYDEIWLNGTFTTDTSGICAFTCPYNLDALFFGGNIAAGVDHSMAFFQSSVSVSKWNGTASTQYVYRASMVNL